jgi:hypothetical protein
MTKFISLSFYAYIQTNDRCMITNYLSDSLKLRIFTSYNYK